jgi:acyl dehydratase
MQTETAAGSPLPVLRIATINSAAGSKGSIHDDEKARQMGYAGGFVPGTTVLGYMTRLMREAFGADFLRSGVFEGRLRRPTYAGVEITVEGSIVEPPSAANGHRATVALRVLDTEGQATATATASCVVTA